MKFEKLWRELDQIRLLESQPATRVSPARVMKELKKLRQAYKDEQKAKGRKSDRRGDA
jgi:hypothetical protein